MAIEIPCQQGPMWRLVTLKANHRQGTLEKALQPKLDIEYYGPFLLVKQGSICISITVTKVGQNSVLIICQLKMQLDSNQVVRFNH